MSREEKVTKIIDGDTFKTNGRKNAVRLADFNAPEKDQPGYNRAKNALENLIGGEEVTINTQAPDKYGRSVARVYLNGKSVNRQMKPYKKK